METMIIVILVVLAAMIVAMIVVLGNVFDRIKSMETRMKKMERDMETINEGYGILFRKMKDVTDTLGTISEVADGISHSFSRILEIVKSISGGDNSGSSS
jgi:uncharacterized protein YoxC